MTNLYLAVIMDQIDHVISRVVIAFVRDLVIRRGTAVVLLVKAGITIMVLIMNRVDIEVTVAHNIAVDHIIEMVHNMIMMVHHTMGMGHAVINTIPDHVIFKNLLERRIPTPPSL